MVDKTLNDIENSFLNLIGILELQSKSNRSLEDYLNYVKKSFSFLKQNGGQKDSNGVLKIHSLGQSISRYAEEFDWEEDSNKMEVNKSLNEICELIVRLNYCE